MRFTGPVELETTKLEADHYTWLCSGCHTIMLEKGGFIR